MMQKSKNQIKELLIVALVTSVFFGVFSVLPMLLFSNNSSMLPPPPPLGADGAGERFRMMSERPPRDLTVSILVVTLSMLTLWLMNIFLYARFAAVSAKEQTKQVVRYVVSYGLMITLIVLYYLVLGKFSPNPHYGRAMFVPFIAGLTNNTIVIIMLDLVVLQRKKTQVELENAQLKMNSIQAQHQHLKHQLHPHFLFNSLNTLKILIKRQPQEAEDYLVRLSEFLRASLASDSKDTVILREELRLCADYLEMQKVRFKNAFDHKIEVPEALMESGYLPVFSLQLLAENAIKHNAFTSDEPLCIQIAYNESGYLEVRNNRKPKKVSEPSSGIGLKNLRERYEVLSDKAIVVFDSESCFTVQLPILSK